MIKNTSRSFSRMTVVDEKGEPLITEDSVDEVVAGLNSILATYRDQSHDIFLTNFKSLRKDGKYRRRLDWDTAKKIITLYFQEKGLASRSFV